MSDVMSDVIEWLDSDEGRDWASVHCRHVHGAVQGFYQIREDQPGDGAYHPEVGWRARRYGKGLYHNYEMTIDPSIARLPSPA